MNVLVIYEEVPEDTRFFLLQNISEDEYDQLANCHGKYINIDDNADLSYLTGKIYDEEGEPGTWHNFEVKKVKGVPFEFKAENEGDEISVIHTGIFL